MSPPTNSGDVREPGPLMAVRVLDLSRFLAGPACGALLADMGADVIRIDRRGGSEDRSLMAEREGLDGAAFIVNNRNKRSIELDLKSDADRATFLGLVSVSDVVLANMPVSGLERLGIGFDVLQARRADIILACITAFGSKGPLADRTGFDGVAQAMSGAVALTGGPDSPTRSQVTYVDYSTAYAMAFAIAAALYDRTISGKGRLIEASLMSTALSMTNATLIEDLRNGHDRQRTGNRSTVAGPSDIYGTTDGHIVVQVVGNPIFARWAKLVGRLDMIAQPDFANDPGRGRNGATLSSIMAEWAAKRTSAEALRELEEARIPAGPVQSLHQMWNSAEMAGCGYFSVVDDEERGSYPLVGSPVSISGFDLAPRSPAPASGQQEAAIRALLETTK
ncbi:CaiB/BaiF CoA transferase family protein [Tianweitania sediminis]|uniref:CoA transferase n=1 Tax=Tianweitania sediminis TaxID=1502156 RepID=A0A8J7UJR2_9HYPH|nr:CoA transferase [Tianweitania sediminis]MBP0439095.1 CoA transferase [Tianweitania sediminis]